MPTIALYVTETQSVVMSDPGDTEIHFEGGMVALLEEGIKRCSEFISFRSWQWYQGQQAYHEIGAFW